MLGFRAMVGVKRRGEIRELMSEDCALRRSRFGDRSYRFRLLDLSIQQERLGRIFEV